LPRQIRVSWLRDHAKLSEPGVFRLVDASPEHRLGPRECGFYLSNRDFQNGRVAVHAIVWWPVDARGGDDLIAVLHASRRPASPALPCAAAARRTPDTYPNRDAEGIRNRQAPGYRPGLAKKVLPEIHVPNCSCPSEFFPDWPVSEQPRPAARTEEENTHPSTGDFRCPSRSNSPAETRLVRLPRALERFNSVSRAASLSLAQAAEPRATLSKFASCPKLNSLSDWAALMVKVKWTFWWGRKEARGGDFSGQRKRCRSSAF